MKKRKFLSCLISLVLVLSLLAGCSGKEVKETEGGSSSSDGKVSNLTAPGELPIVKDKITLSMYSFTLPGEQCTDYEDNDFTRWVEEQTNINLEFSVTPPGEDARARLMVLLATGDHPDILLVNGFNPLEQELYGSQEIILPLNDYIDKFGVETKKSGYFNEYFYQDASYGQ
jgi:putative aldouronate transport system substrate-binding protein